MARTTAPRVQRTALTTSATDAAARDRATAARPSAPPARVAATTQGTADGEYFVQVGAFKDRETARRLAAALRDQNYRVDEIATRANSAARETPRPAPRPSTAASSDRYDVIVSGEAPDTIRTKLAAKGLASEVVGDTVRIRPGLALRDAVALSKDLNTDGFQVQVRRGDGGGTVVAMATPARVTDGGADTLYRVRVGGYPDRAAALAAVRALEGKGYTPFIARGRD